MKLRPAWIKIALVVMTLLAMTLYFTRNLILGTPVEAPLVLMGELRQTVVANAWRGIAINADGTPIFIINFDPMLLVYAAVGATLVGTLAALFPAMQAARLDPAVAIRG